MARRMGTFATVVRLLAVLALVGGTYVYFAHPGLRGLGRLFPSGGEGPDLFGMGPEQPRSRILPLDGRELRRLEQQREYARELALRHTGGRLTGESLRELRALQTLVDHAGLGPEDAWELQALGVALGDIMAHHLELTWVLVQDERGSSRALRYRDTEDVVFPITMISRRVERGARVDVAALYASIEETVSEWAATPYRPSAPGST